MEWRQADVFKLIEEYKERKLLWDATVDDFKNRNKKHDAWAELDEQFGVESGVCERKLRKLISQFNREAKKVFKSGRGAEDSSKWLYFKSLLFLKDKNRPRVTMGGGLGEEESTASDAMEESQVVEEHNELEGGEEASNQNSPSEVNSVPALTGNKPSSARARSLRKTNMAEEAFKVMKGMIANKSERDEFDTFADNVAMPLRKLSKFSAATAKYEINKILFQAEVGHYEPNSRPASVTTTSSDLSQTSYHQISPYMPFNPANVQQTTAAVPLSVGVCGNEYRPTIGKGGSAGGSPSVIDEDETQIRSLLFLQ